MTFNRRARTKQLWNFSNVPGNVQIRGTHYARGRDRPSDRITSAMQIVAERDTPTRQCTSVGSPRRRPSSR